LQLLSAAVVKKTGWTFRNRLNQLLYWKHTVVKLRYLARNNNNNQHLNSSSPWWTLLSTEIIWGSITKCSFDSISKETKQWPWVSPGLWKGVSFSKILGFHGQFQRFSPKGGSSCNPTPGNTHGNSDKNRTHDDDANTLPLHHRTLLDVGPREQKALKEAKHHLLLFWGQNLHANCVFAWTPTINYRPAKSAIWPWSSLLIPGEIDLSPSPEWWSASNS
jgi:hypothetical protein